MRIAALQYCAGATADVTFPVIDALIAQAVDKEATMVCLPEAASFLPADRDALNRLAEHTDDSPSLKHLQRLAATHKIWLLVGSMLMRTANGKDLVNRSHLIDPDGSITAIYDKIHMFDANVADGQTYEESAHFQAGDQPVLAMAGDLNIGMTICYDLRFPHLYRQLARDGADVLMIPAAFTQNSGKAHWHVLLRARAIETGCYVVAPGQMGTHADGRVTYGHSLIVAPWGEIIAEAQDGEDVIIADIDKDRIESARKAIPAITTQPMLKPTKHC
ncbi:MAG: carbon-nitrogen hydrolase family protein [Candidatus Puniceispirillum sp.]